MNALPFVVVRTQEGGGAVIACTRCFDERAEYRDELTAHLASDNGKWILVSGFCVPHGGLL